MSVSSSARVDLDGEFRAFLAPSKELQPHSYRAQAHAFSVLLLMRNVTSAKALRHQQLDGLTDDLIREHLPRFVPLAAHIHQVLEER